MSLKNCSVKKQQHTYIQAICSSYRVLQSWFPSSWFPSPAFLKKYLFVFVLWVVSHMVLCAPRVCSVHRDQKKELDPRNWSYRWLWTALRTLLPNPSPMRKAAWDLNLWALSQNECFVSCSICQFGVFLDLLKTCFLSFCFVCFLLLASLLLLSGISLPLSFFFSLTLILTTKSTLKFRTHVLCHLLESITCRAVYTTLERGHQCLHQLPI